MKLKINANNLEIAVRLPIVGDHFLVYENGKKLQSQWISDGKTGILIVRFASLGEHVIEIKEGGEVLATVCEHSFNGAFPSYDGIEFVDSVTGIAFAERETEEQVGKAYYLNNDLSAQVTACEGELAKVVKVKAYYCDNQNNRAPFSPYAEYKWIFINGLALVTAKLHNAENYAVSVLAPSLKDKTLYKGGYPELSGNAENVGYGFDGYAMHMNDKICVGVFGASCLVLPNCLVGASVAKECCKHGEEICSAILFVGNHEDGEKYAKNGVSLFDYDVEYIFDDFDYEYKFSSFSVYFKKVEGGVKWAYSGQTFSSVGYGDPFCAVTENGVVCASESWNDVCFDGALVRLTGKNGRSAKIYISEKDGELVTSLDITIANIESVYFPQFSVTAKGRVDLFVPSCAGQIENNVVNRDVRYRESYSGPFANMSFVGPITEKGKGLYVCWEGDGERRDYVVGTSSWGKTVSVTSLLYPENMCETGHFSSKKVVAFQTENGWMGMCEKYREYAKNTVWWNKRMPVNAKMQDNRLWLWSHFRWEDENGVLFKDDETAKEWYSVIQKIKNQIDVPLGIMAYDCFDCLPLVYREDLWPFEKGKDENASGKTGDGITIKQHHHETGTNYMPHYTPFRKGVREVFEKAQKENMCILPYVDNRLWDPRDSMLGDYEENWDNTGKQISVKQKDGKPLMEYYCHHLPDGTPANSAVICPYTEKWQQVNVDFVGDIIDGLGVDGIYLDQISAMPPALCMDKTHGHPVGGGAWWREGFEKMVMTMRDRYPNAIFTSECEAEPYMHVHDAYLSWTHVLPNQVPAYSAVYSDRIIQYGRTPICFLDDAVDKERVYEVRASYAQSYLFGEQLGFMFMRAMLSCGEELLPFMNKLLNEREALKEYFNKGRLVCMPDMQTDIEFCNLWGRDMRPVYLPRVCSAVWEYEGHKKLLLVNPFDAVGVAEWKVCPESAFYGKKLSVGDKCLEDGVSFALEPQSVVTFDIIEGN